MLYHLTVKGFTFAYTHVAMPPLITHAPTKVLAKQWLQAYQFAPIFVAPLILSGGLSNAFLVYLTGQKLYALAALLVASIIPYTALYMEPGVNGAGKWKVHILLRDEDDGFRLKQGGGTKADTAKEGWKKWAEEVEMKEIVEFWAWTNMWRYVVTGIAVVVSGVATVGEK
jgi:hypothetical protein